MLKTLTTIAFATALSASAWAQSPAPSIPAATHDWGCEVLLCLANPNGPTAVPPCVPPIQKLWKALARGHAFPTCTMASGPNGRSHVRPAHSYYDHCPKGTGELPVGQVAELAATVTPPAPPAPSGVPSTYTGAMAGRTYAGIGDGSAYGMPSADGAPPPKVCVAGYRGTRDIWSGDTSVTVHLFDTVYVSPAQASPRLLDIYIDDAYWQSVRW